MDYRQGGFFKTPEQYILFQFFLLQIQISVEFLSTKVIILEFFTKEPTMSYIVPEQASGQELQTQGYSFMEMMPTHLKRMGFYMAR